MTAMSLQPGYFDKLYAENPDPWRMETSAYEEAKYIATLAALPRARYTHAIEIGCSVGVLTARLAERCDELLGIDVAQAALDRAALEYAATLLPPDGIMMTTDADSRVHPKWIAANLAELAAGADAVAGTVTFDEEERAALPSLPGRALEWRLAALHARLGNLIDPRAHDPWPNHIWAWGASLALTLSAYRHVGGLPSVPLAEDRALAAALERSDLKVRHSHAPLVLTSARRIGRAPGGFADLLQSYLVDATAPCDAALEPTATLLRRLYWRAWLRRIARQEGLGAAGMAARQLGFDAGPASGFGALWSAVETQTSFLKRSRVMPAMLAAEVALAERWISRIERHATDRDDSPASARVS
jgi:SAM-dependent methyltransferase